MTYKKLLKLLGLRVKVEKPNTNNEVFVSIVRIKGK